MRLRFVIHCRRVRSMSVVLNCHTIHRQLRLIGNVLLKYERNSCYLIELRGDLVFDARGPASQAQVQPSVNITFMSHDLETDRTS